MFRRLLTPVAKAIKAKARCLVNSDPWGVLEVKDSPVLEYPIPDMSSVEWDMKLLKSALM